MDLVDNELDDVQQQMRYGGTVARGRNEHVERAWNRYAREWNRSTRIPNLHGGTEIRMEFDPQARIYRRLEWTTRLPRSMGWFLHQGLAGDLAATGGASPEARARTAAR